MVDELVALGSDVELAGADAAGVTSDPVTGLRHSSIVELNRHLGPGALGAIDEGTTVAGSTSLLHPLHGLVRLSVVLLNIEAVADRSAVDADSDHRGAGETGFALGIVLIHAVDVRAVQSQPLGQIHHGDGISAGSH